MTYKMKIAGLERELPLLPLNESTMIAAFVIFGDVELTCACAAELLKKAPEGTGVIAGGPARSVLELAGISNIRSKSLGSNNKQNVVLATIEGLAALKTPEEVASLRGKTVEEILG